MTPIRHRRFTSASHPHPPLAALRSCHQVNAPIMDPYRCKTCSRSFKRNWHLTRHEQSHSIERPFKCPLCVRVFARQDTLSRHLSSHAKASIRKTNSRSSDGFRSSLSTFSCTVKRDPDNFAKVSNTEKRDQEASSDLNHAANPTDSASQSQQFQSVLSLHEPSIAVSPADPYASQALVCGMPEAAEGTLDVQTSQLEPSPAEPDRLMSAYSQPNELPDELYTSTVDLHARKWLRDLCASNTRVTTAGPND